LLAGCGSKVNTDWDPIAPEEARHPFDDRAEHGEYLATNDYAFSECTPCHGDDLHGVELGDPMDPVRNCTECHRSDNHIIYFDDWSEHVSWMGANGYPLNDCFVCHKSAEYAEVGPDAEFGTTCGTAAGCHDANLGPEACNTCHGEMGEDAAVVENWAPDAGAHTAHLTADPARFAAISCNACHKQPTQPETAGHYNDSTPGAVELTFGDVASSGGSDPDWNAGTSTCSSVHCHGEHEMDWQAENLGLSCSSCHTYPPEGSHPDNSNCSECHGSVVGTNNVSFVAPGLHVNGTVNF
jgi:predicted CxxxxCH...CXXCH cytochrome family protein